MGPSRELFVPQALPGLVSAPAAGPTPFPGLLAQRKAQVHCRACRYHARPAHPACEKVRSWEAENTSTFCSNLRRLRWGSHAGGRCILHTFQRK